MEGEYYQSVQCLYNFVNLQSRFASGWGNITNTADTMEDPNADPRLFGDIFVKDEFLEILLALGNVSTSYKGCWNNG